MIILTKDAKKKIKEFLKDDDNAVIRFGVKGGGCAGFEYTIDLITKPELNDDDVHIIDSVYLDGMSQLYMIGTTIDYKTDFMSQQFTFQNPSAGSACGCGTSFNLI